VYTCPDEETGDTVEFTTDKGKKKVLVVPANAALLILADP